MAWRSHGVSNDDLVTKLKGNKVITSERVEAAMRHVDRKDFCPVNPYNDAPQRIGYNTTISAPHMHAHALGILKDHLKEGARVLDVGTGSGYLTTCMAVMVGKKGCVIGIEHIEELNDQAINNVKKNNGHMLSSGQLLFLVGDGRLGCPQLAPYDAIHVGAASPTVPQPLLQQLKPGGRLFIPVGPPGGKQVLEQYDKRQDGTITKQQLMGVMFVALTDKEKQLPKGSIEFSQVQQAPQPANNDVILKDREIQRLNQELIKFKQQHEKEMAQIVQTMEETSKKTEGNLNKELENVKKSLQRLQESENTLQRRLEQYQRSETDLNQQLRRKDEVERDLRQQLKDSQNNYQRRLEQLQRNETTLLRRKDEAERDLRQQLQDCQNNYQRRLEQLERNEADLNQQLKNKDEVAEELRQQLQEAFAALQRGLQNEEKNCHWMIAKEEILLSNELLGKGGWGEVKVANFRGLKVAAKCLHEVILSDYNLSIFSREMEIAARVRHPNLLQFIGATKEGKAIILSELMPTSLRKELEMSPLTRHQVVKISQDVAAALNYLHLWKPCPIIHRDVSSPNILLEPSGKGHWKAKVSDYGSANLAHKIATTVGPGCPAYSAPESSYPERHSPAMDVYSFGVLLIEMIIRKLPSVNPIEREAEAEGIQWQSLKPVVKNCIVRDQLKRASMNDVLITLSEL